MLSGQVIASVGSEYTHTRACARSTRTAEDQGRAKEREQARPGRLWPVLTFRKVASPGNKIKSSRRTRESVYNFCKAAFFDQTSDLLSIEPLGISLAFL